METDPVCGMDVDRSAAFRSGKNILLLLQSLRRDTQREPERFAGVSAEEREIESDIGNKKEKLYAG